MTSFLNFLKYAQLKHKIFTISDCEKKIQNILVTQAVITMLPDKEINNPKIKLFFFNLNADPSLRMPRVRESFMNLNGANLIIFCIKFFFIKKNYISLYIKYKYKKSFFFFSIVFDAWS